METKTEQKGLGFDSEKYRRVLEVVSGLFKKGEVYISISPPFRVNFEIDHLTLLTSLKQAGMEGKEKDFRRALSEIEEMVLAILRNDEERFINVQIEKIEEVSAKDEKKKILIGDFDLIKDFLKEIAPNNDICKRYKWKASSKAPTYTGVDWDVKEKLVDGKVGTLEFPYATCRIQFQREFGAEPFLILGGRMFDSVQINFSREEAEHVVKTFQRIAEELKRIEIRISNKDTNP